MDEYTFIDAQELQEYHVTPEAVETRETQYAREGETPLRDPTEPWRPNRSEGWERRELLRLAEETAALHAVIEVNGRVLDAALKDRDRLTGDITTLRQHVQRLGDEVERLKAVTSCSGCHAAGRADGYNAALADVRRELLVLLAEDDWPPLRIALDRICPE